MQQSFLDFKLWPLDFALPTKPSGHGCKDTPLFFIMENYHPSGCFKLCGFSVENGFFIHFVTILACEGQQHFVLFLLSSFACWFKKIPEQLTEYRNAIFNFLRTRYNPFLLAPILHIFLSSPPTLTVLLPPLSLPLSIWAATAPAVQPQATEREWWQATIGTPQHPVWF